MDKLIGFWKEMLTVAVIVLTGSVAEAVVPKAALDKWEGPCCVFVLLALTWITTVRAQSRWWWLIGWINAILLFILWIMWPR